MHTQVYTVIILNIHTHIDTPSLINNFKNLLDDNLKSLRNAGIKYRYFVISFLSIKKNKNQFS